MSDEPQATSPAPSTTPGGETLLGNAPAEPIADPAGTPPSDPAPADPPADPVDPPAEPADPPAEPVEGDPEPTVYEFKLPEGAALDDGVLEGFKKLATELKLDPESAQKVLDFNLELDRTQAETFAKQQADWQAEVKSSKNWEADVALARRAVERFGDDDAKALLLGSWLGNNPALLRFLAKVGKVSQEGPVLDGRDPAPNTAPLAQRLFKNMNP